MKADAWSLTFLDNEGLVKIPFFQRGYVWGTPNWDEILSDLLNIEKSHFLGSLILKQVKKQSGKPKEVLVIDGQQRLTTLSILVRAIYNSFDSQTQESSKTALETCLFYKKTRTDKDLLVKIEHSKIDRKNYQKVIQNEITQKEYDDIQIDDPTKDQKSKDSKILQCYKYFSEKLKEVSLDDRKELYNRLLDQENKILVVIDLGEDDDEQSIFDTINSAGVRLSSSDIIKNAMFQRAFELFSTSDEVEKLYEQYWEKVFSGQEDIIQYWETQRATGRLYRDNIEILLHSISVIKGFFDPDQHTLSNLSSLYKSYINSLSKSELVDFLKEISKYADIYKEKIRVFDRSTIFSFADNQNRIFHILNVSEISTFHPYILSLYLKYENDNSTLFAALLKLEKFVFRRMIAKADTKNYNKLCKDFIKDSSELDRKLLEVTDDEVRAGLTGVSNKNAALILFWIELHRRHADSKQSLKELKYTYSLEHIMPQKWKEYWSGVQIVDSSGNAILEKDIANSERQYKIYHIGNMTLLNSSLNTSLRNYEFGKKIEGDGKKKGIQDYSDLIITKEDIVNPYLKGDKVWNEKKIYDRTENLANEIISIWKV
jgi:hypothetical protein